MVRTMNYTGIIATLLSDSFCAASACLVHVVTTTATTCQRIIHNKMAHKLWMKVMSMLWLAGLPSEEDGRAI